jgi:exosortase/archaeosortase family protein
LQLKNLSIKDISQRKLAVAIKSLFIVGVVVAFFLQDLNLVFKNALGDEATYHILAIPFLFGYLLYRKRAMVSATLKQEGSTTSSVFAKNFTVIVGILLCATAVLAYWFGSYTFTPIEYHMLTLPVLISGLILILFNGQTLKQLAFPIAFLFFLTPPPTEILYSVGSTLSDLSAHASNALANTFGMASTISAQYGSPIITLTRPDQTIMNFSVDVACSGVYSLIGFLIFAVFIAYITRGKLWSKFAILIMGIPLIIALNIIRITSILAIGNSYGESLALQVFHAMGATVLMFIGTLILLVTTEKFIKKPKPQQPCPTCNPTTNEEFCSNCGKIFKYPKMKLTKSDIAKIVSIAIVIGLLLSIQAPVFALTEGPAEILVQTPSGMQPNTQILPLPQIYGYNLSYVYRDTNFEKLSGEDASLVYAYGSTDPTKPTVWVAVELAATIGPLHRWETCLINYPLSQGTQPKVTQLDLTDIQTQANPPIVGRYFAFQYHSTNQTQVVLYWYETATFNVNNQTQQKQVKLSLVIYPKSASDVPASESLLLPIAKEVNDYWQPIKTWTTIALTISQNGLALSAATTILLVAFIIYRLFLNLQEKSSLLTLYNKLPTKNQLLLKAVQNAKKQGTPTIRGIADELEKQTNTIVDVEQLKEELQEAQKIGLIENDLVNREDKPTLAWRSLLPKHSRLSSLPIISRFFK